MRLHFEETDKPVNEKLKHNPLDRPMREIGVAAHGKIHQVEKDNSGVEGAHKAEQLTERAGSRATRKVKQGYRSHKLKPYRAAAKAEKQLTKANTDYLYQKALRDNPQLAHSNPLSKVLQKRKIRKDYAKELRKTAQGAKKTAATAKKTAQKATEAAQKTVSFAVRHWKGILIIVAALLIFIFLFSGLSSCGSMLQGGFTSIMGTSYLSKEADMLAAEAAYAAMEVELQYELDNFEALHPGYDEYHYQLDGIFHDPHELAAYLSAKYVTYTVGDVQHELQRIFNLQYELSIVDTGLLYCADCGFKMRNQNERRQKKDGTEHLYSAFLCGNYARSGKPACTTHTISEDDLRELVIAHIRKCARMVGCDEQRIVEEILARKNTESVSSRAAYTGELKSHRDRLSMLDKLIAKLYEDRLTGAVPEAIFHNLIQKYEQERVSRLQAAENLDSKIAAIHEDTEGANTRKRSGKSVTYIHYNCSTQRVNIFQCHLIRYCQ